MQNETAPDGGDGYLKEWPATLQKLRELRPEALVPGRGPGRWSARREVEAGLNATQAFVEDLYRSVSGVGAGGATG